MSVTVEQAYDRDAHLHSSRHAIQLDAETLYLDLVVNSSKVLKSAIRKPSSEITSVEHVRAGKVVSGGIQTGLPGSVGKLTRHL